MRGIAVLVLVGGCSFHGPSTGATTGDGGAIDTPGAPDGSLDPDARPDPDGGPAADATLGVDGSITSDASSGIDATVNSDTDGDGIPDSVDNCPARANPGQENEDGDRFGDVCDPCPIVADDNPPDADGDGVADACDPHPATAGDKIALFVGFAAAIPVGLSMAGSWTTAGGDVHATAPGPGWLTLPLTATGETITASVVVDGATANPAAFGVTDMQSGSGGSGITCAPYIAGSNTGLTVATDDSSSHQESTLAVAPGSAFTISLRRTGTSYTCTATGAAPITRTFGLANAPYTAGLRIVGGLAHYHWLMIVAN